VDMGAADMREADAKELAPGYRRALAVYWKHLGNFFGPDATLADVTYERVRDYEAMRRKKNIRGQSIREEVAALKRAFKIAIRRGLIHRDLEEWPVIRSDAPHPGRRGKLVPMADLVRVLPRLTEALRDELVFAVLTGLRREELCEVRRSWLRKVPEGWVLEVPGVASKTGEARTVAVPKAALEAFNRRADAIEGEALFPLQDHRKAIATACRDAEVPRFTYRDLRTTFATVAQAGADLASVRDAMGHADLTTTNIYLRGQVSGAVTAGKVVEAAMVKAGKKKRRRGGK